MPLTIQHLNQALKLYDKHKGFIRRHLRDAPNIIRLRQVFDDHIKRIKTENPSQNLTEDQIIKNNTELNDDELLKVVEIANNYHYEDMQRWSYKALEIIRNNINSYIMKLSSGHLLTLESLDLIKRQSSEEMFDAIQSIDDFFLEHLILNNKKFRDILVSQSNPDILVYQFSKLYEQKIPIDEKIVECLQCIESHLAEAVHKKWFPFYPFQTDTEKYSLARDYFANMLITLSKIGFLSKEGIERVIDIYRKEKVSGFPINKDINSIIRNWYENGILKNEQDLVELSTSTHPLNTAEKWLKLKEECEKVLNLTTSEKEQIERHIAINPTYVDFGYYNSLDAFVFLNKHNILEETSWKLLANCSCRDVLIAIYELADQFCLNPATKQQLSAIFQQRPKDANFLLKIIPVLKNRRVLSLDSLNLILPIDNFERFEQIIRVCVGRIPDYLFTLPVLQRIIQFYTANPETALTQAENYVLQILDQEMGQQLQQNQQPIFNNAQSTHTQSVHLSSSRSAIQLQTNFLEDWENLIGEDGIPTHAITDLKDSLNDELQKHPSDLKIQAAVRCVERLTNHEDKNFSPFEDENSKISNLQLLVYVWMAMADKNKRIGSFEDILVRFIQGLYEIQRGYNFRKKPNGDLLLNENEPIDDLNPIDRFICGGGTFNKFIEILAGNHKDVMMLVITPEGASNKLKIVAKEELDSYLVQKFMSLKTPNEHREFLNYVSSLKNGKSEVEFPWDAIKDKVEQRIVQEYSMLFHACSNDQIKEIVEGNSAFQALLKQNSQYKILFDKNPSLFIDLIRMDEKFVKNVSTSQKFQDFIIGGQWVDITNLPLLDAAMKQHNQSLLSRGKSPSFFSQSSMQNIDGNNHLNNLLDEIKPLPPFQP